MNNLPVLTSNHDLPFLTLPRSLNYRHESLMPGCQFFAFFYLLVYYSCRAWGVHGDIYITAHNIS
jgi:hypothetical protein